MTTGIIIKVNSASCQLMNSITPNAPKIVMTAINRSSGPWWAVSPIYIKSLVSLDIKLPVLLLS